ncbi:MAG: J domain-containing protein [Myxococcota bacterium]
MDVRDLYATLGVPKSASEQDIRRAYRKLAKRYHPDVNAGDKAAEERFKEVNAAYEVLSNPDKRKLYDEFGEDSLKAGFDPEMARAWGARARGGGARAHAGEAPSGGFYFDPSDLFSEFFGGAAEGVGGRPQRRRAQPQHALIEIEFMQAVKGAEITLQLELSGPCSECQGTGRQRGATSRCPDCGGSGRRQTGGGHIRMMATCQTCGGSGRVGPECPACHGAGERRERKPVTVRIPPGADNGSRLRVPSPLGGPDLMLETRVRPHPLLRREGLDLYLPLPVTLDEAYNGAKVSVPTPDGTVEMRIPPHSQSGTKLRLRGKGVARGERRGDLYVELQVRLPERDDPRFAEAARAASAAYTTPVRGDLRL